MPLLHEERLGHLCILVSAAHIAFDLVVSFVPDAHHLSLLPLIEAGLLVAATLALALHIALERAAFDLVIAAAHAGNLTLAWTNAALEWMLRASGTDHPHWIAAIAGPVLVLAVVATLIELFGLRHKRARIVMLATLAVLALCCTQFRHAEQMMSVPPRTRVERNMVIFVV